jgi:hypothetical protein
MQVEVDVAYLRPGCLLLSYILKGKFGGILMPPITEPTRADNLWQHTCFEAFIGASADNAYYEFNFAPSTQWAAYRFASYRSGMSVATEVGEPVLQVQSCRDHYKLKATLDLDRLSILPRNEEWRLGLAAVIEDAAGGISYWALAHPPGAPNFHHVDCFALDLNSTVIS